MDWVRHGRNKHQVYHNFIQAEVSWSEACPAAASQSGSLLVAWFSSNSSSAAKRAFIGR